MRSSDAVANSVAVFCTSIVVIGPLCAKTFFINFGLGFGSNISSEILEFVRERKI